MKHTLKIQRLSFFMIFIFSGLFFHGCARVSYPPPPQKPPAKSPGYSKPYKVLGKWYQPITSSKDFRQRGKASWYGKKFHGRKTANGETYNMYAVSGAHKTLPLGTYVRVHNLENRQKLDVRINDRGPFVRGRIIDLSYAAAKKLGIIGPGTASVEIVALGRLSGSKTKSTAARSYIPTDFYKGNFTFQVGAFKDQKNAIRMKKEMALLYKNTHVTRYYNPDHGYLFGVRTGRCTTLEETKKYKAILKEKGFEGVFTVAE